MQFFLNMRRGLWVLCEYLQLRCEISWSECIKVLCKQIEDIEILFHDPLKK